MPSMTLAEGIEDALDAVVRSPGGSSLKDDAEFSRVCRLAAARVRLKVGDVGPADPTDEDEVEFLTAVNMGLMYGLEFWTANAERKMDAAQQRLYDSLRKEFDDVSVTLRHEAQTLGVSAPDTDVLDEAFPTRQAESEEDDE